MSMLEAVAGFAVLAGLLTVIPGMDTALIARTTISRSPRDAAATAAGIQCGVLVWGAAAATGAAAVLAASQAAYQVLVYAGAAYMAWLGIGMIRDSFRAQAHGPVTTSPATLAGGRVRGFATGLLTNIGNPKVGVFYVATIPQFVPDGVSPLAMGLLLAGVHVALGSLWSAGVVLAAHQARTRITGAGWVAWLDRITGGVLIAFATRIALAPRH